MKYFTYVLIYFRFCVVCLPFLLLSWLYIARKPHLHKTWRHIFKPTTFLYSWGFPTEVNKVLWSTRTKVLRNITLYLAFIWWSLVKLSMKKFFWYTSRSAETSSFIRISVSVIEPTTGCTFQFQTKDWSRTKNAEVWSYQPLLFYFVDVDVDKPDEKSIMTYVAQFLEKYPDPNIDDSSQAKVSQCKTCLLQI